MNAFPFSMKAETVPLRTDDEGVVRIGKTRITLDVVISAFHQGATPEGAPAYSIRQPRDTREVQEMAGGESGPPG